MIFRLTQKVRDKIKLTTVDPDENRTPAFLEEWYVNHIILNRKQYFIFSESQTLYSVITSAARTNSRKNFDFLATDVLFSIFKHQWDVDIQIFENLATTNTMLKTNNRRIIGSQNDLVNMASGQDDEDAGFDYVNDTFLSYLDYDTPNDRFKTALQKLTKTNSTD